MLEELKQIREALESIRYMHADNQSPAMNLPDAAYCRSVIRSMNIEAKQALATLSRLIEQAEAMPEGEKLQVPAVALYKNIRNFVKMYGGKIPDANEQGSLDVISDYFLCMGSEAKPIASPPPQPPAKQGA